MIGAVEKRPWWWAGPMIGSLSAIAAAANWATFALAGSGHLFELIPAIAFTINAAFGVLTFVYARRHGVAYRGRAAWEDDRRLWRV